MDEACGKLTITWILLVRSTHPNSETFNEHLIHARRCARCQRWGSKAGPRPKKPAAKRKMHMGKASKITADSDCSYEIKRCLLLGRKAITNLDCILKSRDITLLTKVHIVKAMIFPVVMYGCESWTIKKAEHEESMLLNCGAWEDSWESLGLQGDQTSQSYWKSTMNIHWKDWCCSWSSNTLAAW